MGISGCYYDRGGLGGCGGMTWCCGAGGRRCKRTGGRGCKRAGGRGCERIGCSRSASRRRRPRPRRRGCLGAGWREPLCWCERQIGRTGSGRKAGCRYCRGWDRRFARGQGVRRCRCGSKGVGHGKGRRSFGFTLGGSYDCNDTQTVTRQCEENDHRKDSIGCSILIRQS